MTYAGTDYMPLNRQLFRRTIAEALSELLSQKYPTAKVLAREVGIDQATAENLRKGHLSIPTLQKLLVAEGRELWDRIGEEVFGETFVQYEERRLQAIINEAENARSNLIRLRATREAILSGALEPDPAGDRALADEKRGAESRTWAPVDRVGGRQAKGARRGGGE